jgi:hypothetical protein
VYLFCAFDVRIPSASLQVTLRRIDGRFGGARGYARAACMTCAVTVGLG